MITTMYLVLGHTGVYDESRQWHVCAYRDQGLALTHAEAAAEAACALFLTHVQGAKHVQVRYLSEEVRRANIWDPAICMDENGTWYTTEKVLCYDDLPPAHPGS